MKKLYYLLLLLFILSNCSSCSKQKCEEEQRDLTYEDFDLVGEDEETIQPVNRKEYNVKIHVIRRTYLV